MASFLVHLPSLHMVPTGIPNHSLAYLESRCALATEGPVFSVAFLLPCCLQLQEIYLVLKMVLERPSKDDVVYVANPCLFIYCAILTHFFLMHLPQATVTKGHWSTLCHLEEKFLFFCVGFFPTRYTIDLCWFKPQISCSSGCLMHRVRLNLAETVKQ